MKFLPPLVTILDRDKKLVTVQVAECDWCGKKLKNADVFVDDAVRCMYFCRATCKRDFEAYVKANSGKFPDIKLCVDGLGALKERAELTCPTCKQTWVDSVPYVDMVFLCQALICPNCGFDGSFAMFQIKKVEGV